MIKNLLVGACVFGTAAAYAVPAKRGAFTVTQPDGTQLTITTVGDEFGHAFLTADDHQFVLERAGEYFFAKRDASTGLLVPSEYKATNLATRTPEQVKFLETQTHADLGEALELNRSTRIKAMSARSTSARKVAAANPSLGLGLFDHQFKYVTGSPRILVVLVNYTDVKFTTPDTYNYFNAMFNERGYSEDGATGSVLDWFEDASLGKFSPQIDLYGPVELPHVRSYYGGNDRYGNDKLPDQMARDAASILSQQGVDLSLYDNDGNGYVDNVFIYYAGVGEASASKVTDSVWPHSWDLAESDYGIYEVGGVKINHYACTNEVRADGSTDGIGTFIHEFSHVMGLPDLYVTDYNSLAMDKTPGEYDVLDYGPYNNNGMTPPTYSAFARNALGWLDPLVITEAENINLHHILDTDEAYMVNTSDPNEFFLFENRQQKGWDEFIPGHGMLIWHIMYDNAIWQDNSVNNTANKQLVDIVEAIGSPNTNRMAAYPFPGTAGRKSFTSSTTPAFRTWNRENINLPITEITETDGVISAKVAGGVEVGTPKAMRAREVTGNSFTASWLPVPEATDYLLTVSTVDYGSDDSVVLPGYDGVSTAGATSMVVNSVLRSVDQYQYSIVAVKGDKRSRPSNMVVVTMSGLSGVDRIDADASPVVKVDGRTVTVTDAVSGTSILVTDMMGRTIAVGTAIIQLPAAGVYVVHADGVAVKVAVR